MTPLRQVPALGTFARAGRPRYWLFDFQYFPEVVAGETLANPQVTGDAALTIAAPQVTNAPLDGVPAGKGVIVAVTAPTAGLFAVECSVEFSGGGGETIRGTLQVA